MVSNKKISVIITAGGSAERFEQKNLISKQFLLLSGKPLLFYSMEKFLNLKNLLEIIIVTNDADSTKRLLEKTDYADNVEIKIAEGGTLRQDSVFNGFCKVNNSVSLVVIHDVARPLFQTKNLEKCIEAASNTGAAILAVPVVDTIKFSRSDKDRLMVKNTMDRTSLFMVQTPQVFSYNLLLMAYKIFKTPEYSEKIVTDEANMIEIIGEEVELIPGDRMNLKITYPEDLNIAEAILKEVKKQGSLETEKIG